MADYGKRPLWQWIAIYLVVGGILYGAVYYVLARRNAGAMYGAGNPSYTSAPSTGGY